MYIHNLQVPLGRIIAFLQLESYGSVKGYKVVSNPQATNCFNSAVIYLRIVVSSKIPGSYNHFPTW